MAAAILKGQPDVGDVHVSTALGTERRRRRKKKQLASTLSVYKHYGPGPHKNGSPQSIHGGGGAPSWQSDLDERRSTLTHSTAPETKEWAMSRIDELRSAGVTPSSGEEIHALTRLYYQADNLLEVGNIHGDSLHAFDSHASAVGDLRQRLRESYIGPLLNRVHFGERQGAIDYKADEVHLGDIVFTSTGPYRVEDIYLVGSVREPLLRLEGTGADGRKQFIDVPPDAEAPPFISDALLRSSGLSKHYGPGPHHNGTPQSVHGSGSRGVSAPQLKDDVSDDGGFTVDPVSGDRPNTGFMVSLAEYEKVIPAAKFTPDDLREYRATHWSQFQDIKGAKWGAWYDSESDNVFLDISVHFDNQEDAERMGRHWGQLAIFHLDTFTEIRLDEAA